MKKRTNNSILIRRSAKFESIIKEVENLASSRPGKELTATIMEILSLGLKAYQSDFRLFDGRLIQINQIAKEEINLVNRLLDGLIEHLYTPKDEDGVTIENGTISLEMEMVKACLEYFKATVNNENLEDLSLMPLGDGISSKFKENDIPIREVMFFLLPRLLKVRKSSPERLKETLDFINKKFDYMVNGII